MRNVEIPGGIEEVAPGAFNGCPLSSEFIGQVDGRYWPTSENSDSLIPETFSSDISSEIVRLLSSRGVHVPDTNPYVKANEDLGSSSGMAYRNRRGMLQGLFVKNRDISPGWSSEDFRGEHFYPVISVLKAKGFRNIKSKSIDDVDGSSPNFPLEVESACVEGIPIDGFKPISEDAEILIVYHAGRLIKPKRGSAELYGETHTVAVKALFKQGFSNVYIAPEKDLIFDLRKKQGTVSKVTADTGSGGEGLLETRRSYPYDALITVHYREFRG